VPTLGYFTEQPDVSLGGEEVGIGRRVLVFFDFQQAEFWLINRRGRRELREREEEFNKGFNR
jgi:hypothetical protein